jgi:competence protein ComGC
MQSGIEVDIQHACENTRKLIEEGLGRINKDHIKEFIRQLDEDGVLQENQKNALNGKQRRLFRFSRSCRFKKVYAQFAPVLSR